MGENFGVVASENIRPSVWRSKEQPCTAATEQIVNDLGVQPLVARLLLRRGFGEPSKAREFLQPRLEHLLDPFLMFGMREATERLLRAINNREKIVVMGDYDVDGVTSCALLVDFLRTCAAKVEGFIPNRFKHGHGLNKKSLQALLEKKPQLVVTVDHGVSAYAEIAQMQATGVDTIVTDHHIVPSKIPAGIVVNPHQSQCKYPFKQLAGCGVVFKLLCALRKTLHEAGYWQETDKIPRLREYLDLVALGTVADVVALNGENRILVHHGLFQLAKSSRPGIKAMLALAGVVSKNGMLESRDISFVIAPRINAAGRMEDAELGLELLLSDSIKEATMLAQKLDELNIRRREVEKQNSLRALSIINDANLDKNPALVVVNEEFHQGVLGIVASKLVNHFGKPCLVFSCDIDGNYRGSARGIEGYHVHDAIVEAEEFTLSHGGHAFAGGCLVSPKQLDGFIKIFLAACGQQAAKTNLAVRLFEESLSNKEINLTLASQISALAPFGNGNEIPHFKLEQTTLRKPPKILNGRHLKWDLGPTVEMIAWNQAHQWREDAAWQYYVQISINEFRGNKKILLTVKEMQRRESSVA